MIGPTIRRTVPQAKPPYPEAFDRIAGLPPEINPHTISLLIQIWRHTNSDNSHENFSKAWMAQSNLAREMHLSDKTLQRAFDDGCARGLINREHLFKKNGKVIVSSAPYHKATSKEMGEYLGSRYWLNWSTIKKLQVNGVVPESTPNYGNVTNGVVTEPTPNSENRVVRESIRVVRESTPVVRESTKGLIEGVKEGTTNPPTNHGSDGRLAGSTPVSKPNPKATDKENITLTEDVMRESLQKAHKNMWDKWDEEKTGMYQECGMPMIPNITGCNELCDELRKRGIVRVEQLNLVCAAYESWWECKYLVSFDDYQQAKEDADNYPDKNIYVPKPIQCPFVMFRKEFGVFLDEAREQLDEIKSSGPIINAAAKVKP
jgi:hypothetical protein